MVNPISQQTQQQIQSLSPDAYSRLSDALNRFAGGRGLAYLHGPEEFALAQQVIRETGMDRSVDRGMAMEQWKTQMKTPGDYVKDGVYYGTPTTQTPSWYTDFKAGIQPPSNQDVAMGKTNSQVQQPYLQQEQIGVYQGIPETKIYYYEPSTNLKREATQSEFDWFQQQTSVLRASTQPVPFWQVPLSKVSGEVQQIGRNIKQDFLGGVERIRPLVEPIVEKIPPEIREFGKVTEPAGVVNWNSFSKTQQNDILNAMSPSQREAFITQLQNQQIVAFPKQVTDILAKGIITAGKYVGEKTIPILKAGEWRGFDISPIGRLETGIRKTLLEPSPIISESTAKELISTGLLFEAFSPLFSSMVAKKGKTQVQIQTAGQKFKSPELSKEEYEKFLTDVGRRLQTYNKQSRMDFIRTQVNRFKDNEKTLNEFKKYLDAVFGKQEADALFKEVVVQEYGELLGTSIPTAPRIVTGVTGTESAYAGAGTYETTGFFAPQVKGKLATLQLQQSKFQEKYLVKPQEQYLTKSNILTGQKEATISMLGLGLKTSLITKQEQQSQQKYEQPQKYVESFKFIQSQPQRYAQKQVQRQILMPKVIQNFYRPIKQITKPGEDIFFKPSRKPTSIKLVGKPIKSTELSYLVYTRKAKKPMLVSTKPLSRGEALALGVRATKTTARASFQLIPTKAKATSLGLAPITEKQVYGFGFRPPIKKGKTGARDTFIQLRSTRLGTRAEVRAVQSYKRRSGIW